MNNYWSMMEQVTLSDRKKEEIMDMLENKGTQKRRMPKAGKLILAAALAVGCVLSIAAGLPAQVYNFMSGGTVSVNENGGSNDWSMDEVNPPIVQEDGKLWFVNGEERTFTTKEFDLLTFLAENPNHVYTKEELFQKIWDMESIGDIATVTVHIKKIREKIEVNTSKPQYIETIWGVGYRFKV